jgi:hypothetical protein
MTLYLYLFEIIADSTNESEENIMNANTMLTAIQSNALTSCESINKSFVEIAEITAKGENNAKELAKQFYAIQSNPDREKSTLELGLYELTKSGDKKPADFKKLIENVFHGIYTGNTAYKYAQCYKYFHNRNEWNTMNVGKLIILTPLMNDKAKNDGYGINSFYIHVGCEYYRPTVDAHNAWLERNETALATIAALESSGNVDLANKQREMLEPEPVIMGFVVDETTGALVYDTNMCSDKGMELVPDMSDKALKTLVSDFIKAKTGKASKDDASKDDASKDDASKEKTIAELKADALAALQAYTAKLEEVPKALDKAIAELNKE